MRLDGDKMILEIVERPQPRCLADVSAVSTSVGHAGSVYCLFE